MKLTPKMRAAITRLEQGEAPVSEIGRATVAALMNRGLAEISENGEIVSLPPHKHQFVQTMHMDGCHWFASSYECECGAQAGTTNERSSKGDAYAVMWLEPGCERCEELRNGARPRNGVTIVRAKPKLTVVS
jgi:hypothetical protein